MPKLFLIPCPIAENALHTLPAQVQETVRALDIFLVERAKTARHFVKSLGPARPIQEMSFVEMDAAPGVNARQTEAGQAFLQAMERGKDVGVLSEAGCPGIADPGAGIVALAHQAGVQVTPLVGPSSILLALMASGMNGQRFAFHGYLPPKRLELARDLRRLEALARQHDQTQVFIETPYRSQMVLEVALECLQPNTQFGIAQDLTGEKEFVRSLPVRDWAKSGPKTLEKLPCVFMVYGK
jgi:16S rRNA (cytidine1402-2'-O)-methyltransferase